MVMMMMVAYEENYPWTVTCITWIIFRVIYGLGLWVGVGVWVGLGSGGNCSGSYVLESDGRL